MCTDGKTVRLVAQSLNEIEHRIARLEHDRAGVADTVEVLTAGVAIRALGDADEGDISDTEFLEDFPGYCELTGTTIDQDEVRPGRRFGEKVGVVFTGDWFGRNRIVNRYRRERNAVGATFLERGDCRSGYARALGCSDWCSVDGDA